MTNLHAGDMLCCRQHTGRPRLDGRSEAYSGEEDTEVCSGMWLEIFKLGQSKS